MQTSTSSARIHVSFVHVVSIASNFHMLRRIANKKYSIFQTENTTARFLADFFPLLPLPFAEVAPSIFQDKSIAKVVGCTAHIVSCSTNIRK